MILLSPEIVASLAETVHDLVTMPNGVTPSELLSGGRRVPRSFASRALRRVATKRAHAQDGADAGAACQGCRTHATRAGRCCS